MIHIKLSEKLTTEPKNSWRDATGSNWKYIKECGVVDPAFLSYLNFDQGAAKAIGVKIRRFRCQQSFSVTGNTLLLNKYHRPFCKLIATANLFLWLLTNNKIIGYE